MQTPVGLGVGEFVELAGLSIGELVGFDDSVHSAQPVHFIQSHFVSQGRAFVEQKSKHTLVGLLVGDGDGMGSVVGADIVGDGSGVDRDRK